MADGGSLITINAKTPTQTYTIEVASNATISDVKDKILTQVPSATKDRLCIIYTGKILKDEETLTQHKIDNGHTIHLVIRSGSRPPQAQPTASAPASNPVPSAPLSGAPQQQQQQQQPGSLRSLFGTTGATPDMLNNPDMMREMMNNPMVQAMMNNPDIMRTILSSNPQFQQLIERNPEVGHLLNDPNVMRQTMEMIRNPNMFQEMMRNHDIAIRNLQGIPGGEAALERLYNDVQEPLLSGTTNSLGENPFASLRGDGQQSEQRSDRAGQENSEALPNPWAPRDSTNNSTNNQSQGTNTTGANPLEGLLNSPGYGQLMNQMLSDPNTASSLFNPQMMQMMRQTIRQNPQYLDSLLNSNPALNSNPQLSQEIRQRLPDMLEMISNPEGLQALRNPRVYEAFQQIQQGFATLRQEAPHLIGMFTNMSRNQPTGQSTTAAGTGTGTGTGSGTNTGNDISLNALTSMLGTMGMSTGGAGIGVPPTVANPEQEYAAQLEQLQSMGFSNRAANIAALTAAFGDLNAAVERLLNSPR